MDRRTDTLHRLDMVVAGHRGSGARAFPRPQVRRFLHFQQEGRGACLKASLDYTPSLTKPQQLSKHLLRCHRRLSSRRRQAPPFPLEIARNHPEKLIISCCYLTRTVEPSLVPTNFEGILALHQNSYSDTTR